jgi:hypothetical protein
MALTLPRFLAAAFSRADAAPAPVALEEDGAAAAVLLGQAPAAGRDAVRWSSRSSISSSTAAEAAVTPAEKVAAATSAKMK